MQENIGYDDNQLQRDMQTIFERIDRLKKIADRIGGRIDSVWNFLSSKWGEEDKNDDFALVGNELTDNEQREAIQAPSAKRELFREESPIQQVATRLKSVLGEKLIPMTDKNHLPDCLKSIRQLSGSDNRTTDLSLERSENNISFTSNFTSKFSSISRNTNESAQLFERLVRSILPEISTKFPESIHESSQRLRMDHHQEKKVENSRDNNRFRPDIFDTTSVWSEHGNRSDHEYGENASYQILAGQESIKAIIEKNNRKVIELLQETITAIKKPTREENDFILEIG